jgi:hypothetical protein
MSAKYPPRILRVTYRGANGRVARFYCKVPYSGVFALSEVFARLLSTNEVRWFRIEPAPAPEIETHRSSLERWPEAFRRTLDITKVNLLA